MADDEIVILDEEDLEEEHPEHEALEEADDSSTGQKSSKLLYLILLLLILLLITGGVLLYLLHQKKERQKLAHSDVNTTAILEKLKAKPTPKPRHRSEIQRLLERAQRLYAQHKPEEALALYRQIARYNKALSLYNIGVARMQQGAYRKAIDAFKGAMESDRLKCESALNIAVCGYMLHDRALFRHSLETAEHYLPLKWRTPLYSYLKGLIHYYRDEYPETLLTLAHPTSDYYTPQRRLLQAKLFSALRNDTAAISALERFEEQKRAPYALDLGLLYARIGTYDVAAKYLSTALGGDDTAHAAMALALVDLKRGLFADAAKAISDQMRTDNTALEGIYPIRAHLKASLFDPVAAQKEFQKELFRDPNTRYGLLFYYAPFKLFDADQTLRQIDQGVNQLAINETIPALKKLKQSEIISRINLAITKGVEEAHRHHIYAAKRIFEKSLHLFPNHATLHYDLALTYARLFDYDSARTHFRKSYALDPHNHRAAIFALYCTKLLHRPLSKPYLSRLKKNLYQESSGREELRLAAMLKAAPEDAEVDPHALLEGDEIDDFDLILALELAHAQKDPALYFESARRLHERHPRSIVATILYLDAKYGTENIKRYAEKIQQSVTLEKLDDRPLFFGGALVRELYVNILNIAGITRYARKQLLAKMRRLTCDTVAALQTLAYIDLFTDRFEEAYRTYNTLIDSYDQKDAHTLFLASVAAMGAHHNANAIALMELAKLTEPANLESRYALGILYQEAKNFQAAAIQYQKIGNSGFHSHYFDFSLKKK